MSDRVLFISGRCDHCKKILVGIQQHAFLKPLFNVVNVDVQPYPNYVKSVPSILINNQVISGQTVFEYFGKLVEGKKAQEQRIQENQTNESDQGQCRINEEGELEGYCVGGLGGSGVEFSMITEENDDYTKKTYKIESSYDFLDGASDDIHSQVKSMEAQDSQLSQKRKGFDNDLERMQRERGELMNQQSGPGMGPRPPMGQGPGRGQGSGMGQGSGSMMGGGQNMMR